ncbi:L-asparaginase [Marinobacter nitratireducens]|uniref:asparaginase n=1 Tax=Marinobacter nitratireducens TaxID=1137280 RepID=A0A072N4H6_9GAMM|nr:asparaginase [Marinobacter nitratireducens]KEF31898.1 L-asparaginase [Marinobacter nitratireducens]
MNRRVLVLYTGGTIGMVSSGGSYVPGAAFGDRLTRHLGTPLEALPHFDVIELDQLIDSANLSPTHWHTMAEVLIRNWERYDGFVLLHGTDTMAYTASALSYILKGANKPVILTGSQIPLEQPRTDAVDNVTTSLMLAARPEISEVCVCFRGKLIRGNRSRKLKTSELDAFDSPNAPLLGRAAIHLELRHDLLLPAGQPDFQLPDFEHAGVASLVLYPGISAAVVESILAIPELKGLVLQSYGAGNAPDADADLIKALEQGINRGITVINVSQCPFGQISQTAYASGAALARIGVVSGADLTPEAAFAKLHFLLATGYSGASLRRELQRPRQGDLSVQPH